MSSDPAKRAKMSTESYSDQPQPSPQPSTSAAASTNYDWSLHPDPFQPGPYDEIDWNIPDEPHNSRNQDEYQACWNINDPRYRKRMGKRLQLKSMRPRNLENDRTEIVIPSWKGGRVLSWAHGQVLVKSGKVVIERSRNPSQLTLITLIGAGPDRAKLSGELQKMLLDERVKKEDIRIVWDHQYMSEDFRYCGVCYELDHTQETCQNCSYCQKPDHWVDECTMQTIVSYTLESKSLQKQLFDALNKDSWKYPFRLNRAVDAKRRFLCRFLGPEHRRREIYELVRRFATEVWPIKLRDTDTLREYCKACFDTSHNESNCDLMLECQECKKRGHRTTRCPSVSLFAVEVNGKSPNQGTKALSQQFATFRQNYNVSVKLHQYGGKGLIILKGSEAKNPEIIQALQQQIPLAIFKKPITKDSCPQYCVTCACVYEDNNGHWSDTCLKAKQNREASKSRLPVSTQTLTKQERRKRQKGEFVKQDEALWKNRRFFADFLGMHASPGEKVIEDTLLNDDENLLCFAGDVEKGQALANQVGLCVCLYAIFRNPRRIVPAYFSYINNAALCIKGLEFTCLTTQAVVHGEDPEIVKNDILTILKNKTVWFHQWENDVECLGITREELARNKIIVKDSADEFRDPQNYNNTLSLKDLVYTHFTDIYGRPKRIQEYTDKFLPLGGHNCEVDARFEAQIVFHLYTNPRTFFKDYTEVRRRIQEDQEVGLLLPKKQRH